MSIVGVTGFLRASTNSMSLGRPSVTFLSFTPAKWNVLRVIWVPGSPIDCAVTTPTASPGSASALSIRSSTFFITFSTPSLLSLFSSRAFSRLAFILGLRFSAYFAIMPLMTSSVAFLPTSTIDSASMSLEMLTASPWSLLAGSIPSSPYRYCTMLPCGSRTVWSYSIFRCSSALMSLLCM